MNMEYEGGNVSKNDSQYQYNVVFVYFYLPKFSVKKHIMIFIKYVF